MSVIEYYDEAARSSSTFDPEKEYLAFKHGVGKQVDVTAAKVFFLNAKKAKDRLRTRPENQVALKFATWQVTVVNTHFFGNRDSVVGDSALTLHRLSGYLARSMLEKFYESGSAEREVMKLSIINPIAESHGIKWDSGPEIYFSFFPGTEMFLERFHFYPLAIGIYRVKHGMMDAQFLKKTLRQRYGNLTADQWMQTKAEDVKRAVTTMENLKWGRKNLGEAARQFLLKFGIDMPL
uniref:Nucleoprotein n=1 Tax=Wuhan Louse Fly Virus 1 TaxID=1608113 RepID=A0A0B5KS77_9VIRU|nr:nucleocapsid protein [Wuhan Louse Fly Virus 1]